MTERHTLVEGTALAELEPDIASRFSAGLHYAEEAHMETPRALAFLLDAARDAGVEVELGTPWYEDGSDGLVIDCRGMGAREALRELRGVRGERFLVRTHEVHFSRSIHLLHPRQTLYVVPWSDGVFLIGATLIESEDTGPVSVRSALELLGLAYALHPAFGEAQLIESAAGLRPIVCRQRAACHRQPWRHADRCQRSMAARLPAGTRDGRSRPGSSGWRTASAVAQRGVIGRKFIPLTAAHRGL